MQDIARWAEYQALAEKRNVTYPLAVALTKFYGDRRASYSQFTSLRVPNPKGLARFSDHLAGLTGERWQEIEKRIHEEGAVVPSNPVFDDAVLTAKIEQSGEKTTLIEESFEIGSQMHYVKTRFGLIPDESVGHLSNGRIGHRAGQAALEVMLEQELIAGGYDFPNVTTFLNGRETEELLGMKLQATHPLVTRAERQQKQDIRSQYKKQYLALAFTLCIAVVGAGMTLDGAHKWMLQRADKHSNDLEQEIQYTNNKIDGGLLIDFRYPYTEADIARLKDWKAELEKERDTYNSENYGGKWWRLLLGLPLTFIGVGAFVDSLSRGKTDLNVRIDAIRRRDYLNQTN